MYYLSSFVSLRGRRPKGRERESNERPREAQGLGKGPLPDPCALGTLISSSRSLVSPHLTPLRTPAFCQTSLFSNCSVLFLGDVQTTKYKFSSPSRHPIDEFSPIPHSSFPCPKRTQSTKGRLEKAILGRKRHFEKEFRF